MTYPQEHPSPRCRSNIRTTRQHGRRSGACASGLSIIEIVLVAAIMAILVAILVPVVSRVRQSGWATDSIVRIRGLGQHLSTYSTDYRDAYPYMDAGQWVPVGGRMQFEPSHWSVRHLWPGLVFPQLAEVDRLDELQSPGNHGRNEPRSIPSDYAYSLSFVADPSLWDLDKAASATMLRAVRVGDVQTPARKVLLYEAIPRYIPRPVATNGVDIGASVACLFADGSASPRIPAEATAPVPNRLYIGNFLRETRLNNTPLGVRGTDY